MAALYDALRDRVHMDNLIVVGQDYTDDGTGWDELENFVVKYRQVVNPNLLFVRIDLSASIFDRRLVSLYYYYTFLVMKPRILSKAL